MKQHTIKINNKAIIEKEFIKYLGVFIDSTLSWKHQISNISKIFILQKRAMRLMTYNDKYPTIYGPLLSSDPICFELEMLKVSDIYKYQVSKLIFKYINKMAPINFHNWFKINHETWV